MSAATVTTTGDQAQPSPLGTAASAPDQELFRQLASGDVGALGSILQEHRFGLTAYASRIVENSDEAEDVVQEVFVRLWERRATWTPAASVSALLYRMTRNLALNRRRHQQVRTRSIGVLQERTGRGGAVGDPAATLEAAELEAAVHRAIQQLPPRRREVFLLARFHGLRYQEIATLAGVSVQTVANQMSAAITQLRRAVSRACGEGAPSGMRPQPRERDGMAADHAPDGGQWPRGAYGEDVVGRPLGLAVTVVDG